MVYPQSLDGMSLRHSIDEDIPEDLRPAPGGSWGTPCLWQRRKARGGRCRRWRWPKNGGTSSGSTRRRPE
eukprot:12921275-Prorocentrum_lima.AAC.1